jgi:hypothetical protein
VVNFSLAPKFYMQMAIWQRREIHRATHPAKLKRELLDTLAEEGDESRKLALVAAQARTATSSIWPFPDPTPSATANPRFGRLVARSLPDGPTQEAGNFSWPGNSWLDNRGSANSRGVERTGAWLKR